MTFHLHAIARSAATAAATTTVALISTLAQAQLAAPEVLRGPLPLDLGQQLRAPLIAKVAVCPAQYTAVFLNNKLSCERRITQVSDVKCPAAFPTFTARNVAVGTDRDLCAKAGVVITSNGALTDFRNNQDYVFVPRTGVRDGVSFVAADATVTAADGWLIETTNLNGITDRYRRVLTLKTSPLLVNP
jgi:hypothetical protein